MAADAFGEEPPAPVSPPHANHPLTSKETPSTIISLEAIDAQDDLVSFAKQLRDSGVKLYGASWSPATTEQRELFADGSTYLDFVEVTEPDRTLGPAGIDNGIDAFPVWERQDGARRVGVLSLSEISEFTDVAIPTSSDPSFKHVADQTLLIGSPLHLVIDAYDSNGDSLTTTANVDRPDLVHARVLTSNRSARISVEGFGDMVFQLFENRAPNATGRFIELAEQDFYSGIIFHRVIESFVIQGGDPTGTGTGGSSLGDFDDDFHRELQHNQPGVLSYAKSADDTNDSQFFVTDTPTRFLDFNHSVFGQLVEGDDVRQAINKHETQGANGKPTLDIVISSVEIFEDTENSIILLEALDEAAGQQVELTITVADWLGNASQQTAQLQIQEDTANSQPFLRPIDPNSIRVDGNVATLQLSHVDVEDDPVIYFVTPGSNSDTISFSVDQATGRVNAQAPENFSGTAQFTVGVRPAANVSGNQRSDQDTQLIEVAFDGTSASQSATIDLLASSDSGLSNSDDLTNDLNPTFLVSDVQKNDLIEIWIAGEHVGTAVSKGASTLVNTAIRLKKGSLVDTFFGGPQDVVAYRVSAGTRTEIARMDVNFDIHRPTMETISNLTINQAFPDSIDIHSPEEHLGLTYELIDSPPQARIDSQTGVITWTDTSNLTSDVPFIVQATDKAGNVGFKTFEFRVDHTDSVIGGIHLRATDPEGNPIQSVTVGESFYVEMLAQDLRIPFDQKGVFSAYTTVRFDEVLATIDIGSEIMFPAPFNVLTSGVAEPGVVRELGATNSTLEATNDSQNVVAIVPMTAVAPGSLRFLSEPALELGNDFLLYGRDDVTPNGLINFGTLDISVFADNQRDDLPQDVNGDGLVTAIDALKIVNIISAHGGPIKVSEATLDIENQYDVALDGWITLRDALVVINWISESAVIAESEGLSPPVEPQSSLTDFIDHRRLRKTAVDEVLTTSQLF